MDLCCLQDVLQSLIGMQLADMQRYSQLTPVQQTDSALPRAHPPAKSFCAGMQAGNQLVIIG